MAQTRLAAVEMGRSAGILYNRGVGAHMISDVLDVGYVRNRRIRRWVQGFWLEQLEGWICLQLWWGRSRQSRVFLFFGFWLGCSDVQYWFWVWSTAAWQLCALLNSPPAGVVAVCWHGGVLRDHWLCSPCYAEQTFEGHISSSLLDMLHLRHSNEKDEQAFKWRFRVQEWGWAELSVTILNLFI